MTLFSHIPLVEGEDALLLVLVHSLLISLLLNSLFFCLRLALLFFYLRLALLFFCLRLALLFFCLRLAMLFFCSLSLLPRAVGGLLVLQRRCHPFRTLRVEVVRRALIPELGCSGHCLTKRLHVTLLLKTASSLSGLLICLVLRLLHLHFVVVYSAVLADSPSGTSDTTA